jgi:hypothetical protein
MKGDVADSRITCFFLSLCLGSLGSSPVIAVNSFQQANIIATYWLWGYAYCTVDSSFWEFVTTKVARLETTKTRSHKGTKKRKSFEILGVLSVFAPLW